MKERSAAGHKVAAPPLDPESISVHPLTPDRWGDLETLFGPNGAYAGCWCMWWRIKGSDWFECKGEKNRQAFREVVEAGEEPGLIAYVGGQPAGWIAIAPRNSYMRLREERVRIFKKVDEEPVWTITCFYIARPFRRRGLMLFLLKAGIQHVARRGGTIVEGYPVEPGEKGVANSSAYTGLLSVFQAAGFVEVLRRHERRPIMRYYVDRS